MAAYDNLDRLLVRSQPNDAAGAVPTDNPSYVGGLAAHPLPNYSSGELAPVQQDLRGRVISAPASNGASSSQAPGANTTISISISGVSGQRITMTGVLVTYTGGSPATTVTPYVYFSGDGYNAAQTYLPPNIPTNLMASAVEQQALGGSVSIVLPAGGVGIYGYACATWRNE